MSPTAADAQFKQAKIVRAEELLKKLRLRIERHSDQEVRLNGLYRGWQRYWTCQCEELDRHIARLQAHVMTWMPKSEARPMLSVVGACEIAGEISDVVTQPAA